MKANARTIGNRTWLLVAAALSVALIAGAEPAGAQSCDVPLFVQQGSVDANVMILFDNSGSMNEAMFHPDYNPSITYTGYNGSTTARFGPTTVYYVSSDANREPNDFIGTLPSTPSAWLVNSDGGQSGRYYGNYLNWIYFHANATQRAAIPRWTRVQVAKAVTTDIVRRARSVRFGLTVFNTNDGDPGGTVSCALGADTTTVRQRINAVVAQTWTPLGETMEDILTYYKRTSAPVPITESCQWNFLIVMTDGFPTHDQAVSAYLRDADGDGLDPGNCESLGAPYPEDNYCTHYMDDVAYYMRHNDLRSDLSGDQTVITYTIGFGIDAGILQLTADDGDGFYLMADNATQLWLSLARVMQDIITRVSSGSAVAVVSTERGDDDRLYRGKFMPGLWQGYLEAFSLPYEQGEPSIWEAGDLLANRDPGSRTIFTALDATTYNFEASRASDLMADMGIGDADSAANIIQWARGYNYSGYRDRSGWVLGDIIHSTPIVVGAPANFAEEESYQAFAEANRTRTKMIYVGANDGMLHAFRGDTGEEAWAFVPQFALPKLKVLADSSYCHTYTCDLTCSVKDVRFGDVWKTVLVSGGREGGSAYFALDVTDPLSPEVLWQTDLPANNQSFSEAEFAFVAGAPVVLVGSGLDASGGTAKLTVLDLATGAVEGTRTLSAAAGTRNKCTTPKAVDEDLDGVTDVVYCGDMRGNLWRCAPDDDPDPNTWGVTRLFQQSREITAQPAVAYGENGRMLVYFGTGAYLASADLTTTAQNSFYCVFDEGDGASLQRADLRDQSDEPDELSTGDSGWFVDLWNQAAGERVTEKAVVVANTVYFTSFAPSSSACEAGGRSWLYHLKYDNGGEPEVDEEHEETSAAERSEELGEGVASRPVVDIVNENIIVQSSDATIAVQDIGSEIFHLTVRSWQENYDFSAGADSVTAYP